MKACFPSKLRPADDMRIVEKEVRSLSRLGYAVPVIARPPPPCIPGDIRFKLIELAANPARAIKMGLVRSTAVCWHWNWEDDATELKNLYDCDLSSRTDA
jgi:hypothetical protein